MDKETKRKVREHGELFWEFFKMGLFTIGGGMAMLPLIQKVAVEDKGWMKEEEMVDCLAVSQSLPGVIAINSATYIGKKRRGLSGALAATLGVVMPSFLIIIAAVTLLGAVGDNPHLEGAFVGIKAAVCGLVLLSAKRLGKQILKDKFCWTVAICAFVAIGIFRVTALWGILAGAAAGVIYTMIRAKREETD